MGRAPEFRTRQLAPQPVGPARVAQSDGIAQGVAEVGRQMASVGQAFEERDERHAQLYAAKAMSDARAQWTRHVIERKESAEGEATGFAGGLSSDFETYAREVIAQAPARAQRRLALAFQDYGTRLAEDAMAFEATKRVAYREEQAELVVNQNANLLVSDPSQMEGAIAETMEAIDALGLPADKARAFKRGAQSTMTVAAMKGLIDRSPGAVLSRVQGGEFDAIISPSQKMALMNAAQAEIKSRQAKANAAANAARAEWLSNFKDTLAFTETTGAPPADTPYTQENLIAVLGEEKGAKAWEAMSEAMEAGQAYATIRSASPEEVEALLAEVTRTASDAENFIEDQKQLDRYRKAWDLRQKSIAADPVAYAVSTSPVVQDAAKALTEEATPEDYRRFTTALEAEYDRLGVDPTQRRVLSPSQAKSIAAQINAAPEDEAGQVVKSVADQWGGAYGAVARELETAGLEPGLQAALKVADDPSLAARVVGAFRNQEKLEKALTGDQKTAIKDELDSVRSELVPVLTGADYTGRGAEVAGQIMRDVEALATLYAAQGDGAPVERAYRELVDDRYFQKNDGNILGLVPRTIGREVLDESELENTADAYKEEDRIRAFNPVPFNTSAGVDFLDEEATVRTAARRGVWVPNGTDMVLMVPVDEAGTLLPLVRRGAGGFEYYSFPLGERVDSVENLPVSP